VQSARDVAQTSKSGEISDRASDSYYTFPGDMELTDNPRRCHGF